MAPKIPPSALALIYIIFILNIIGNIDFFKKRNINIHSEWKKHILPSCELAKITDRSHFVKNLLGEDAHVFFLRLNPDAYDKDYVYLSDRIKAVAEDINLFLSLSQSELNPRYPVLVPNVGYYYYHSKAQKHIDVA